jgi:glycosyltransferase involved in cell wall biosynthesis
VIRKGVDLSAFQAAGDRAALRREVGLDSTPMILTVGGLIPRKGIHHIIASLAQLAPSRPFTFVVCGDGPERSRLEALAASVGLGDRVRFLGRVPRNVIPKYFAACDVFILASIVEAAGNVLFEAMASGRPVVCTDSGGPGEYIRDGETGFITPVGDTNAMAARVATLLDDPALQDRMGDAGRRRTLGEFDYGRMVQDIIGVYEETLGSTARSRR